MQTDLGQARYDITLRAALGGELLRHLLALALVRARRGLAKRHFLLPDLLFNALQILTPRFHVGLRQSAAIRRA